MKQHSTRRTFAAVLALTVAGSAPMVPAFAAAPSQMPAIQGLSTSVNPGTIDPAKTVTLDIHKHLGATTTVPNDGTAQTVGLPTLQGVDFDVYEVTREDGRRFDLSKNAEWLDATAVRDYTPTPTEIKARSFQIGGTTYKLAPVETVTTGANGIATFSTLNKGVFFVNENLETSTDISRSDTGVAVPAITVTPSAPFFVTLPMTEPNNRTAWMYDVHVYPKNQVSIATKSVADYATITRENGNAAQNTIVYTINTSITDGITGAQMGTYRVQDILDARLAYLSTAVAIDPDGEGPAPAGAPLTVGTHYTVTAPVVEGDPTKVLVEFTPAGLDQLATANDANAEATVVTTIRADVREEGINGTIDNTATFIPNQAWLDVNPGSPGQETPPVRSYYGDIELTLTDPVNPAANLGGAEYVVYRDADRSGKCEPGEVGPEATVLSTMTVDENGKARFLGLQTSTWYDGDEQGQLNGYCLVAIKAPEGYNLVAEPNYISLDHTTAGTDNVALATLTIPLAQKNLGNDLPLTGGAGIAGLSLLGIGLIGAGAAYYAATNRRKQQA